MGKYWELNFDGLVGPNHNYSGLSHGNIASVSHGGEVSSPREAALQGLAKAEYLIERGFKQAIVLPQERPNLAFLRQCGFAGSDQDIIEKAFKQEARLLSIIFSSSSMWTANAATVMPSLDTRDGKAHLVVANLYSKAHRAQESTWTHRYLARVFKDQNRFMVHKALEGGDAFADEGAANHTRLASEHGKAGFHIFAYGRSAWREGLTSPRRFMARQTLEASQAVARLGGVEARSVFVQQSPEAIDAGVFHNDVICVGNERVLFSHEDAFTPESRKELESFLRKNLPELDWVEVKRSEVSLAKCVSSYLFNSQLLSPPGSKEMFILCPSECANEPDVATYLDKLTKSHPFIKSWVSKDLRQSMRNGGGPACLRLRVQLSDEEIGALHPEVLLNKERIAALRKVVKQRYREKLPVSDLRDPQLLTEIRTALDELSQVLNLGSIYPFQS
jgi:succinylarginine dihydrolase